MAGEVAGKLCEAATVLALLLSGKSRKDIAWGKRPRGMSVTSDILLGKDPDNPDAVILVTHSVSAMQSHKKFWRNVGELVELKTLLDSTPKVLNVVFGSAEMKKLSAILTVLTDYSCFVKDLRHGLDLHRELSALDKKAKGTKNEEVVELLNTELSKESKLLLASLGRALMQHAGGVQSSNDRLWQRVRGLSTGKSIAGDSRHLKRGAAKLLVLQPDDRRAIFKTARDTCGMSRTVELARKLGFLGGLEYRRVTDPDIIGYSRRWTLEDLDYIECHTPMEDYRSIAIGPVRAIVNLPSYGQFVAATFQDLTSTSGMLKALKKCHDSPGGLCPLSSPVRNVWLVDYVMSAIKAHLGGHNMYGQSQLAEAAGVKEGISASGYRIFADWLNRKPKGQLPIRTLQAVACALATEMRQIGKDRFVSLAPAIETEYLRTYVNIKLLTYEMFDPVCLLIERELKRVGIDFKHVQRLSSVYGEIAGIAAATSDVLLCGKATALYWNSSTDLGRDHKRKELVGRVVGMRWAMDGDRVVPRSNIRRAILVLDGSWEQSDFDALLRAGWDEILYVDDIVRLGKLID